MADDGLALCLSPQVRPRFILPVVIVLSLNELCKHEHLTPQVRPDPSSKRACARMLACVQAGMHATSYVHLLRALNTPPPHTLQAFHNISPEADLFNNINKQFWE